MCPVNVGSCMLLEYGCFHNSSFMSFCFRHQRLQACVLKTLLTVHGYVFGAMMVGFLFFWGGGTNPHTISHGLSFSVIKNIVIGRLSWFGRQETNKQQKKTFFIVH